MTETGIMYHMRAFVDSQAYGFIGPGSFQSTDAMKRLLDRPLRVTLKVYDPKVNPCTIEKRTLAPVPGCWLPGIYPQVFDLIFRSLRIPYEVQHTSVGRL